MSVQDVATTGPTAYTNLNLMAAIQEQYPIVGTGSIASANYHFWASKVEIWGPTAGIVSLSPVCRTFNPYFTGDNLNNEYLGPMVDTGTATRRPYVTFTWPEVFQNAGSILGNAGSTTMFTFTATSGGTAFGTYCILYVHFGLKVQTTVAIPGTLMLDAQQSSDRQERKRAADEKLDEMDRVLKVAKIKALTLPPSVAE